MVIGKEKKTPWYCDVSEKELGQEPAPVLEFSIRERKEENFLPIPGETEGCLLSPLHTRSSQVSSHLQSKSVKTFYNFMLLTRF